MPYSTKFAIFGVLLVAIAFPAVAQESTIRIVGHVTPVEEPSPLPETLPPPKEAPGLALAELERLALSNNPSLRRASALVGAARGNWVQVGLLPNPAIGYEGQQLGSGGRAEQHGVLVTQEFVRGGKLALNRAVAEQEVARLEQELAAQQQRVLTDVRVAFYLVLVAQRQIDLTANLLRVSQEGSHAVDSLFRAKEASKADVLQAELEVENSAILAQNARNRHDAAWRGLAAVVGDQRLQTQALAGDAFAPPREFAFQETLQRLQSSSPEVASAAAEIERARSALSRARVEPIPNVSVQGLMNWRDNGIDGKPDAGVAVSVPLPLFNRNQGAILRAEHEVAAAEQALGQLELDLSSRLAATYERYANARNQVERYRTKILPAAEESLRLTRQTYEGGESSYVALLTAQRTYSQIHLNYLDAIQNLRIAETEMEGYLLRGSLPVSSFPSR